MNAVVEKKRNDVVRLCQEHGVKELYAFGSAAEGGFEVGKSDYDFLVRFLPASAAEHANRYFGLLEALQDLFHTSVDLVEIDAITNSHFRRSAEQTRVRIYAA